MPFVLTFPDIDPEIFTIPVGDISFSLRWYALAYIVGLVVAWRLVVRLMKRPALWPANRAPMTPDQPEDLLTWMVLGVILGGRIGYVLFYDFVGFAADPWRIVKLWEGGMSFHGGFLGVIVATIIWTRMKSVPLLQVGDAVAVATPPGLMLGRLANFINAELVGRPTDVAWAMRFPTTNPQTGERDWTRLTEPRHPSQLYEAALEGLILFVVLWILATRFGWLKRPGALIGVFFLGYALARFTVEYFREPDPQLAWMVRDFGISMGQTLTLPMMAIGLIFLIVGLSRRHA